MQTEKIGALALEAMLVEVSVTPKPGLVDRNNSGAHVDMDFFTFMRSAASLGKYFEDFSAAGFELGRKLLKSNPHSIYKNDQNDKKDIEIWADFMLPNLFLTIREIGIKAEKKMFKATKGTNTHKGEIFSLGVLCACAGFLNGIKEKKEKITPKKIMEASKKMCAGLCERDFAGVKQKPPELLTKGERVYLKYGVTGIRGEAENGYPTVKNIGLPTLKKYLSQGFNINDALSMTLIHIMANASDTNIISRHDIETAQYVMKRAKDLISNKFGLDDIKKLDDEFIERNISPGGSCDLLAVTYFLHMI